MFRHVEIKNNEGFTLRGYLNRPDNAKEVVVFFHGYTGCLTEANMHFKKFSRLLEKNNVASLRFDYTGNGESDGEFLNFSLEQGKKDVMFILDYAFGLGFEKVNVLGFSMGGLLASCTVNYKPISKLVLWSAASVSSPDWKNIFNWYEKMDNGNYYNCGFEISKEFLKGLDELKPFEEAKKTNIPVLICQGQNDNSVDWHTADKYHEAFENSLIHFIPDAHHTYEKFAEQQELYETTLKFILNK